MGKIMYLDEEYTNGGVDYIIEQGTEDIWTYRKWNSGIIECWCNRTVSVNFDSQIALSLYTSGTINITAYPDIFSSIEEVFCSGTQINASGWATLVSANVSTDKKTVTTSYMAWTSSGTHSVNLSIHMKGK